MLKDNPAFRRAEGYLYGYKANVARLEVLRTDLKVLDALSSVGAQRYDAPPSEGGADPVSARLERIEKVEADILDTPDRAPHGGPGESFRSGGLGQAGAPGDPEAALPGRQHLGQDGGRVEPGTDDVLPTQEGARSDSGPVPGALANRILFRRDYKSPASAEQSRGSGLFSPPSCGYGGRTPERRSRPVTIALP